MDWARAGSSMNIDDLIDFWLGTGVLQETAPHGQLEFQHQAFRDYAAAIGMTYVEGMPLAPLPRL